MLQPTHQEGFAQLLILKCLMCPWEISLYTWNKILCTHKVISETKELQSQNKDYSQHLEKLWEAWVPLKHSPCAWTWQIVWLKSCMTRLINSSKDVILRSHMLVRKRPQKKEQKTLQSCSLNIGAYILSSFQNVELPRKSCCCKAQHGNERCDGDQMRWVPAYDDGFNLWTNEFDWNR